MKDTSNHNMEYNSQKTKLIIPEYGRNVQMLIKHAKTIEEDDYRQAFVEKIVGLMQQMNPQNKNIEDYREKLWMHVFRIADYDINVVPPSGEVPTAEMLAKRPERIAYPPKDTKYRHYGHHVKALINKALEMEEGRKKQGFVTVIASYMKLAYKTWIKEHYVSDDIIIEDLKNLSNGALIVDEGASLDTFNSRKGSNSNNNSSHSNNRRNNNNYSKNHHRKKSNHRRR